ncbi:MAG: HAMP domain-containing histidine kinase [Anaeroplasmataceae bacterium]|nr:HAMP domain-containing histidine kinase [Anaeroplasmataceae bacterium]
MKKLSISGQITIIFLIVLLFSATLFTTVTLSRIKVMAENETYTRLVTYSALVDNHTLDPNVDFSDMKVAFIKIKKDGFFYSDDIEKYINDADYQEIIKSIERTQENSIISKKIKNFEDKTIYYVITFHKDSGVTIMVTNALYVTHLTKTISIQLILVFLAIISVSILFIALWGNNFAKRLHRLKSHIGNLPKTGYGTEYIDDGLDEVGELSRALESMRIEIKESEQQKQEMLQNMSHDFKTPIAVIKSYAEAQQDGMADESSSKIIIAQAEKLKHKVNRLLQYNSLEYLQKDREFEDVNMKEVVEEVIEVNKFQTNLEIELDLKEDVFFKGYRENYFTVVDNIFDNAKRYAKSKIKIVLRKDRLRIYNDGDPIDEQFIKHAFKPYEKGSKGEFGLGMSIVQKTLDFFGMQLIAKNESIGVSFIITK